ncbi:hypothetical protein A5844_000919 [Enterococcus sp. 10A9_DIV0425]|uniref:Mga helix-turn-helix domain-containing protein n=1 Tax=Candidatus Enterococcus wittei TaxID=1987383 RepID=A0A242JZM6_9ENTE|nr:helix-turn-helix domain containing protein [Enterococcus sp. 10A9_DIV0425]OTP10785.1 hypothetical protein A5844_000919 [Enterococcus sp. 10A9_DIV0425]THE10788.1 HTH domain-containing protein [Enterococcus hirae]
MLNNLAINLHRDKMFSRQVKILEILNASQRNLSVQELAKSLGVSSPTLTKELALLKITLPSDLFEIQIKANLISITYAPNVSINSAIQHLAMSTLEFRIMWSIIENKKYSIQRACLEFHCSRSHLFRTIKHMNISLKTYSVSISTNTIELTGREVDIRFSLFVFFSAFGDSLILDSDSSQDASLLLEWAASLETSKLHYSHFRLTLWLSIVKKRWRYSYFVDLPEILETQIIAKNRYLSFSKVLHDLYFFKHRIVHLPEKEILWAFIVSLHCVSYENNSSYFGNDKEKFSTLRRDENPTIVEEAQSFIRNFYPPSTFTDSSVEKLVSYLINVRLLSMITPCFELVDPQIKTFVETTFKSDYLLWNERLENFNSKSRHFSFMHIDHLSVTLTLLSHTVQANHLKKKLKIACVFQGGAGLDAFLVSSTELFRGTNVEILYYFEFPPTQKYIINNNIDLVVSNYDINVKDDPNFSLIRLSNIPTLSDWTVLKETIDRLRQTDYSTKYTQDKEIMNQ